MQVGREPTSAATGQDELVCRSYTMVALQVIQHSVQDSVATEVQVGALVVQRLISVARERSAIAIYE